MTNPLRPFSHADCNEQAAGAIALPWDDSGSYLFVVRALDGKPYSDLHLDGSSRCSLEFGSNHSSSVLVFAKILEFVLVALALAPSTIVNHEVQPANKAPTMRWLL